jgi:hydrogenase nickel incorporation protein HypB
MNTFMPMARGTATSTGMHEHGHSHAADEGHGHSHAPGLSATRRVQIEQDILSRNNAYAHENRQHLAGHGIFALNLVSGPGSGKTTLLCKTITMLGGLPVAVIEGDQQTSRTPNASGPPARPPSRSTPARVAISTPTWSATP